MSCRGCCSTRWLFFAYCSFKHVSVLPCQKLLFVVECGKLQVTEQVSCRELVLQQVRVVCLLFVRKLLQAHRARSGLLLQSLTTCKAQRCSLSPKVNKMCAKPVRANVCVFSAKKHVFREPGTSYIWCLKLTIFEHLQIHQYLTARTEPA